MRTSILIAACWLAAAAQGLALPPNQPIRVTGGQVSGVPGRDASITVFKGIPFAAPPVGERRWQAPAPVVPWSGVRAATAFGPSCIQTIVQERKPWTYEFMAHNEISEDCLHLNVWTGAKSASERRPVFVYIYGGGFNEGSTAIPVYDGEGLASKGLVVVTANYRVGVLGFLAHPELSKESDSHASGNYGLLDQVAALRWIHDNIAAFGGDPNRVTIAGQSAGGMSVHSLIASPLAKGLFHRAIVQSGGSSVGGGGIALRSSALADAEASGVKFAAAKGAASLAALRAMTWQTVVAPIPAPAAAAGAPPAAPAGLRFSPIVDGYVLPAPAREVVAQGRHNDVPVLTGANLGELGGISGSQAPVTAASFAERARRQYGPMADEYLKLYPAGTDEQAARAQSESSRDQALVSMYLWARERAKTSKTPSFIYLWDHTLPGPDADRYGAFHTSEVPYVLNTLAMSDRPFTPKDRAIADMMSSYWASFAAKGDPNGTGVPAWAPVGDARTVMEVGDKTGQGPLTPDAARFTFFEKFLLLPAAK
jgi:para-nitrobenzyl esterase